MIGITGTRPGMTCGDCYARFKHPAASFTKARARWERPAGSGFDQSMPCFSSEEISPKVSVTIGLEHRIVAEALSPRGRPDHLPTTAALEQLLMTVGPGDDKRRHEMRPARSVASRFSSSRSTRSMAAAKSLFGPAHRAVNRPGRAVERIDAQAGIVGDGRQARGFRGGMRLDGGILGEHVAGLVRLGQAELAGGHRLIPKGASNSCISRSLPALWSR